MAREEGEEQGSEEERQGPGPGTDAAAAEGGPAAGVAEESPPPVGATGQSPRTAKPGTVCCCHICFESGGRRHTKSCDGRRWAGTGSTDPPGPPGSGGGGGDDGKGDGPKKKKNRPSQKQRKRLAAQREAANRGADEEAGPPAEVKQEDPDYSGEELEELGGLARPTQGALWPPCGHDCAPGMRHCATWRRPAWSSATPGLGSSPRRFSERQWPTCASAVTRVRPCTDPRPWAGTRSTTRCTPAWRGLLARRGRQPVVFPPPRLSVPLAPWERLLVTGVWHLLRADELAFFFGVGDVVFVTVEGRPTALRVAKSKTDQAGHGTVVARACVCSEGRVPHCPACCLKEQWEARVGQLARARSVGSQEARLFLEDSGLPLTTAQISGLVEDYAAAQGLSVKAEDGSRLYGSHSLRVTGALLAFHAAGPASAAAVEVDMVPPPQNRQAVAFGAEEMLVQHGITGILHKPSAVSGPAHTWSTRCGWKWAETGLAGKFRAGQCCGTCFRP